MASAARRWLVPSLAIAAALFSVWAIAVFVTGGFHVPLGSIAISSRKASRPALLALGCIVAILWQIGPNGRADVFARGRLWWRWTAAVTSRCAAFVPRPRVWAATLALAVAALAWTYGSQTAGGSDAFAYLSQAALIRTGRLDVPVPLAPRAPWPDAAESFAPLGYRARADGRSVVPITAPGMPMIMAGLQIVGGHRAAFLVPPFAGALVIWLTFLIGRRVSSDIAGLAAAFLVATSPAFLFNVMWPMSDVVAALWAALLVWLLLSGGVRAAALAGLAASLGILTRPNFTTLAAAALGWLVVVALVERRRETALRPLAFAAALVPGVALAAWFNIQWFGRALASGYGSPADLLSLDRAVTNASLYLRWLLDTSPILAAGIVALLVPSERLWGRPGWRVPLLFLGVSAATVSIYLVYLTFDVWWYLRFLLPMWPLAAVGVGAVAAALSRASRMAGLAAFSIVLAAGWQGAAFAHNRGVFLLGEDRYATVATLVAASTESTAVVLTHAHSGSIRYYAGRETIRFNAIEPPWLDRTIEWLDARGRKPYLLIEDWELPDFRARFGTSSIVGTLNFAPAATWESTRVAGRVFLYDLVDRDRFATVDPGEVIERHRPRSMPSRFPKLAFEGGP